MKNAVIIAGGAADLPLDELDGRTPIEVARTPNLDVLAQIGRVGTAALTPNGCDADHEVCWMSLLGYDPGLHPGVRAPLKAAAMGLTLDPIDWVFHVDLVAASDGQHEDDARLLDASIGAITGAESRTLFDDLRAYWKLHEPELMGAYTLIGGEHGRGLLVDSSGSRTGRGREYQQVETAPPQEIVGSPWVEHLPAPIAGLTQGTSAGEDAADVLCRLIELSRGYLATHPINAARRVAGKRPANMAWIWGHGRTPRLQSFADRFGVRGAMINAADVSSGLATLIGWDRLDVPGMTCSLDTDYAAQGRAACGALDDFDLVCCHVDAPHEASRAGDLAAKIVAIEEIDRHVVGPVMRALERFGDAERDANATGWRMLVLPDCVASIATRKSDPAPVPLVMAGAWVRSVVPRPFHERSALASDLKIRPGDQLMEYFLKGGQAGVRVGRRVK
ncbi:MAG: hypothetical protein K2W85_11450 [Phycisphaerales bacterium]|nr:hypothetical protein [Phycisphaerales bacterium]